MTALSFRQACSDGDLDEVKRVMLSSNDRAELTQGDVDDGLLSAIKKGQLAVMRFLLDHGVPILENALAGACERGDPRIFQEFLNRGWDPNTQFYDGEPVQRLCQNVECMKLLLDSGADPNLVGEDGVTPLATCMVSDGGPELADLLVSYGAVIRPEYLYDALHPDAVHSEKMTAYLIAKGADVNTPSDRWSTPLHFAIHQQRKPKVELLLAAGADPSVKAQGRNYNGMTPSELAKSKGQMDIFEVIEEARAKLANEDRR